MKIRFTEVHVVAGSRGELVYMNNDIIEVEEIMKNGWARIEVAFSNGLTSAYIPPDVFELVDKERTYTEAEMKAMRTGWEERWIELQNQVDSWKDIAKEEGAKKLERERSWSNLQDKYFELEGQLTAWKEGHDYLERELSARKRKLDLLEPEIQKIEEAIRLVVPEDEEETLAGHIESIVSELHLWRRDYGKGRDFVTHHSIAGRVADVVGALKPALAELDKRLKEFKIPRSKEPLGLISSGPNRGRVVFSETEHPEDVYARQHQESKPRRVRGIR